MKNPTPKEFVQILSITIGLIVWVSIIVISHLVVSLSTFLMALLIASICAVVAYVILYSSVERFLYRKIKNIYKIIRQHKSSESVDFKKNNMVTDIISDINNDVKVWMSESHQEKNISEDLVEYRRQFLGDVSHELKTPLFNAQGYISTLIDGGLTDEKINLNYLYKASKNLDRLENIIEDLMTISNFESGEISLNPVRFDVHQLTLEVFDEMEVQADQKEITLSVKEGCERTFWVKADQGKIKQVITNLVTNAIRYGEENGNVWVGFYEMDDHLLTEVSDDGIGIDSEHLDKVFSRFYRIDKSRKRVKGSSGLGLSIVKHIIEAHDQNVHVRSTIDVGSTFGFTLQKD